MINPNSADPTTEPGPPSEKNTDEPTLESNSDALSEPSAPTREDSMEYLSPRYKVRYQKGQNPPKFSTIKEHTKEPPWGDTWKIRILGQDKSLESG